MSHLERRAQTEADGSSFLLSSTKIGSEKVAVNTQTKNRQKKNIFNAMFAYIKLKSLKFNQNKELQFQQDAYSFSNQ